MKRINFIIYPLLFLICASVNAGELTGKTYNSETGNPVEAVTILIIETGQVTASSKYGTYEFTSLDNGVYHLLATHVSFDPSDTIVINVTGSALLDINMSPSPWVLNEVVVTGTRTPHLLKDVPVQTEVVSQRDFRRTGATTVDQALKSAIGINIQEDLNGLGAQLRGIEGDRVLLLIDGERAVGRVRGSLDLGQFDLSNVEKIEVVKGTGSTLYGSEAMGGVINIITKRPKGYQQSGEVYLDYGSHNSLNASFDYSAGSQDLSWILSGRYFMTDGFDLIKSTLHTNGIENIDRLNINGKLIKKMSTKWNLVPSIRYMREKKTWIESDTIPIPLAHDDEEINDRLDGSLTAEYLSGDKYSMKFRLYGTYYDHDWSKVEQVFKTWVDTSKTQDYFYEASYNSSYVIGSGHVATYGLDYNYQSLSSTELEGGKQEDKAGDAYLQYEYSPLSSLTFLSGVRFENHSSFGSYVNPSFNIMYRPYENFKVRGFVGRGFRAPSIKQLYFIFDHSAAGYIVFGGLVDIPPGVNFTPGKAFDDLSEERSINSSLSFEFSYGALGLHRLTYFYNHLDNLIDIELLGFSAKYWRGLYVYQNIESAMTQGIEWESRVRLNKSIDLSFSYNYLFSRNLTAHEELLNRPKHTLKFFLTWLHDNSGFGGSFYGDYQSRKLWVSLSNTGEQEGDPDYAPERTTLNFNLFKRFGQNFEMFARVENLLDEINTTYGYWPERTISTGFRYNLDFGQ